MSRKEQVLESINSKSIRRYTTSERQSWRKLGIGDEDGWNEDMRKLYFNFIANFHKAILKFDYTDPDNRPNPNMTKHTMKLLIKNGRGNNYAEGWWSDAHLDQATKLAQNFSKFVVWNEFNNREKGKKPRKMENIANIQPRDWLDYIRAKKEGIFGINQNDVGKPCTNATLKTKYVSQMQKLMEATSKYGVKSHKSFLNEKWRKQADAIAGIRRKEERIRNIGKTDGKVGYTLEQANKIILAAKDDPFMQTLYAVATYVGLRFETLRKMQWTDIIDPMTGKIGTRFNFLDGSKLKGKRPLSAMTTEEVNKKLQELYDSGAFKFSDRIWGDRLSASAMYKHLRNTCEKAGVDNKAFHAFRSSTTEYYDKMAANLEKSQLANGILEAVNTIKYLDHKSGEWIYPLNPIEDKKEWVRDRNGKPVIIGKNRDGSYRYKTETVKDPKTGKILKERKYTYDKLTSRRLDWLKDTFTAEQISHNRSDANAPYRNR